jgi:phosphohistidine phosphatase
VVVFLVRHAHAAKGEPDESRPLSERGRSEARLLAEALAARDDPPVLVLTSPLLRARQTAEVIASAAEAELRVDERLAPGATADLLVEALAGEDGPVAAIGHQPDCSHIALALTGTDPGFPTGGMVELTTEGARSRRT